MTQVWPIVEHPQWFWTLTVVLLCGLAGVVGLIRTQRHRRRLLLVATGTFAVEKFALAFRCLAIALVGLALVDFRGKDIPVRSYRGDTQLVFVMDESLSMGVRDLGDGHSRRETAKEIATTVHGQLSDFPTACVRFAAVAEITVPLTTQTRAVREAIEGVPIGDAVALGRGSRLTEGIRTGIDAFAKPIAGVKHLIILTDGELPPDSREPPWELLPLDATVWLVVLGDDREGGYVPDVNGEGPQVEGVGFLRYQGKRVRSRANPRVGERLAMPKGTRVMHHASSDSTDQTARRLADSIINMKRPGTGSQESSTVNLAAHQYHLFLLAAWCALMVEFMLSPGTMLLRRPSAPRVGRRGWRSAAALAVLVVAVGATNDNPNGQADIKPNYRQRVLQFNEAVRRYREGDFEAARVGFAAGLNDEDLALRRSSAFNLGNTLYKTAASGRVGGREAITRLRQAIGHYQVCLSLGHRTADCRANIRLAEALIRQVLEQRGAGESGDVDQDDSPADGDQDDGESDNVGEPDGKDSSRQNNVSGDRNRREGNRGSGDPEDSSESPESGGEASTDSESWRPMSRGEAERHMRDVRDRLGRDGPATPTSPDERTAQPAARDEIMPW